ncbi:hypothetical protein [Hyphomicrobium sp. CS1GBMeth3]|uniref:hypothetical protein n=1 Tax=Hyphomicrobium sp. CS1GBMeth3 TaxID=1892845 RepID=UPI0009319EE6|nr:hypothetical protein [Hyphomicrobium sp. CS1GBMeth3]
MPRKDLSPHFRKHLPDLLAGLAVFALLAGLTAWHLGIAASSGTSAGAMLDRNASAVLLAGAVTAIVVFNVAFVGHLRRAYATTSKTGARPVQRNENLPRV